MKSYIVGVFKTNLIESSLPPAWSTALSLVMLSWKDLELITTPSAPSAR